ncbi:MAG: MBL fold metallo-hydrolase [Anaeromyxobacteraceae bacterium]
MPTYEAMLEGSPAEPDLREGSLVFVGTATVLVQAGGFSFLTDPNFLHAGDHAHLGYGLTSERLTEPALRPGDLPPLDFCLLSHLHGDHWDRIAERELPRRLRIVTTPHAARALRGRGFPAALGLRTWQTVRFRRASAWLEVMSLPARHAFGLAGRLLPPVMGSLVTFGLGGEARYRIYVSGDTLLHRALEELPVRFPDLDLGLFHLGGTRVLGLLVTMDAEQGVAAVRLVNPKVAIPLHFDDYRVFRSPLGDFLRAAEREGLGERIHVLTRGERYRWDLAAPGKGAPPPAPWAWS